MKRTNGLGVTGGDTPEESRMGSSREKVEREIFYEYMEEHGEEIIEMYMEEHGPLTTYSDFGDELISVYEICYYTEGAHYDDLISDICKVICKNFNVDFEAKLKIELAIYDQRRIKTDNEFKIRDIGRFISRNLKHNEKCKGIVLDYNEKEFEKLSIEKAEEYRDEFSKRYDCTFEQWKKEEAERSAKYKACKDEVIKKIMKEENCDEMVATFHIGDSPLGEGKYSAVLNKIGKEIFD